MRDEHRGIPGAQIPHINILPQVAPLQSEESNLRDDYVSEHYYTRLSSRHFRNQIFRSPEYFQDFKALAEETWRGLRIAQVENNSENLSMLVTDGDFAAEVAWMGHGLQMWLQTIWFVAKTPTDATVVLDEPDVYMHPDLQRKLYRLIKARFAQAIIPTLQPTVLYRWQKEFFENGPAAFQHQSRSNHQAEQERIQYLEKKIQTKDEVLAELMAQHIALKKSLGEL